eukprot:6455440-Amphidinium_carterae.1
MVGSEGSALPKSSDAKSSKPGPEVCKSWNTDKGCRFGKSCKFRHPYAKISDGLCFVCGAKEHSSKSCPFASGAGKAGSAPTDEKSSGGPGSGRERKGQSPRSGDGSGNRPKGGERPQSGSGNRPKADGKHQKGGGKSGRDRKPSGGRQGSAPKSPSARSADADSGKPKDKPSTPRAANPARALSAALDLSSGSEGLLDSGASHVIAPLEELPESEKEQGQKVALTLASGRPMESVILQGEVYAQKVRRVLIPFGKLVRQTGLVAVWSRAGLMLMAADGAGQLRLVCKPTMRQGGMPHIPTEVVRAFR